MWAAEEIPRKDRLYLRVHRGNIRDGAPIHRAFIEHGGGMSTNWERYATPWETRRFKKPEDYGVGQIFVGEALDTIDHLEIEHTPDWELQNRSHTDVRGTGPDYKPLTAEHNEARVKMRNLFKWVINQTDPLT